MIDETKTNVRKARRILSIDVGIEAKRTGKITISSLSWMQKIAVDFSLIDQTREATFTATKRAAGTRNQLPLSQGEGAFRMALLATHDASASNSRRSTMATFAPPGFASH